MAENTEKKRMPGWKKFLVYLTVFCVVLLLLYVVAGITVRDSICKDLEPVVMQLKSECGTDRVKVQIFAEPGDTELPFFEEFHVFLTVLVPDVEKISESDALQILRGGKQTGEVAYAYEWSQLDYAVYARTARDYMGFEHPVFVTISDGARHYSLQEGRGTVGGKRSDILVLNNRNSLTVLHPPVVSTITLVLGGVIVFLVVLLWLAFKPELAQLKKYMDREKAINEEVKKLRAQKKRR